MRRSLAVGLASLAMTLICAGCTADDPDDDPPSGSPPSSSTAPLAEPDPAVELAYWASVDPCAIAELPTSNSPTGDDATRVSQRTPSTCLASRTGGKVEVEVAQQYTTAELAQGESLAVAGRAAWRFGAAGNCVLLVPTSFTHGLRITAPGEGCDRARHIAAKAVTSLDADPAAFARPAGSRPGACALIAVVAEPDYADADGSSCPALGDGPQLWIGPALLSGHARLQTTRTISSHRVVVYELAAGDRYFVADSRECAVEWELGPAQSLSASAAREHATLLGRDCASVTSLAQQLIPDSTVAAPEAPAPDPFFYPAGADIR